MSTEAARASRYAVYFAADAPSVWARAGAHWLGRCAATSERCTQVAVAGMAPERWWQLSAEPRRYGWHATLKAPFSLRAGVGLADLRRTLRVLASEFSAFDLPPLRVHRMADFLALRPIGDCTRINAVANACMTRLHPLAAPLSALELERRRRKTALSDEEDALLLRWGYPYVLQRFGFHVSLSGSLHAVDAASAACLQRAAQDWFDPLPNARFESLALFAEPAPGADFVLLEHFSLLP